MPLPNAQPFHRMKRKVATNYYQTPVFRHQAVAFGRCNKARSFDSGGVCECEALGPARLSAFPAYTQSCGPPIHRLEEADNVVVLVQVAPIDF